MGATGSGGFVRLPCPDLLHRDRHSASSGNLVLYTLQQILVDAVEILICASVAYPVFLQSQHRFDQTRPVPAPVQPDPQPTRRFQKTL